MYIKHLIQIIILFQYLNKIDLPASDVDKVKKQIEDVIGIETSKAVSCSGKTGEGVEEILETIVSDLPSPKVIKSLSLNLYW